MPQDFLRFFDPDHRRRRMRAQGNNDAHASRRSANAPHRSNSETSEVVDATESPRQPGGASLGAPQVAAPRPRLNNARPIHYHRSEPGTPPRPDTPTTAQDPESPGPAGWVPNVQLEFDLHVTFAPREPSTPGRPDADVADGPAAMGRFEIFHDMLDDGSDETLPAPGASRTIMVDTGSSLFFIPSILSQSLGLGPFVAGESAPPLEGAWANLINEAIADNEAENERHFEANFRRIHAGSVSAMRTLIDELRGRDAADIPEGGVTAEDIDCRHWEMTYKLPALLLVKYLPQLCEGEGRLADIRLFDADSQKAADEGGPKAVSPLPAIYRRLMEMHDNDKQALVAALPGLQARLSQVLEAQSCTASPQEKPLVTLIQEAVHRIQGQILYETLGNAHAHLPTD